jgi:hypothetical protein
MMNLQEFISETIRQIIDGVVSSQEHAQKCGAYVNPTMAAGVGAFAINKDKDWVPEPRTIEFDVAVTTSNSQGIQGGMGIFVADVGVGYKAKQGIVGSEISHVKFSIPVVLPSQTETQQRPPD